MFLFVLSQIYVIIFSNTIAGSVSKDLGIWTIQVEVNCAITNGEEEIEKLQRLIEIFVKTVGNAEKSNY